jgi:hypothetical protein
MGWNIFTLQASLITFKPLFNPKFGKIKRKAVSNKTYDFGFITQCMFVTVPIYF